MSILNILNNLSATTKKTKKEAILNSNKDNPVLKLVFQMAYDKVSYTFNIRKINQTWLSPTPNSGSMALEEALQQTNQTLCKEGLRGHTALDFVGDIFSQLSLEDKEVYRRVLLRDLEVGCSESTANKVWEGCIFSIPKMLAQPHKPQHIKNIIYPAIAQKKADGVRGIAVIKNGEVNIYSRNSNIFDLPTLEADLSQVSENVIIDGELIYVDPDKTREEIRQTGNGIVGKALKGSISEVEEANVHFVVWDIIDYDDYFSGECNIDYDIRFNRLEEVVSHLESERINTIETEEVESLHSAEEIALMYIDQGFEGIVLKNKKSPWQNTRSKHLVKFKAVIDFDLRVVGYYPHKKDPNKLGGLILESECGKLRTDCGTGFKDKSIDSKTKEYIPLEDRHEHDRELLMSYGDQLIGKIVEGECNGVSTNKNAKEGEPQYSLHFPVFKCFREDKEAANNLEDIGL